MPARGGKALGVELAKPLRKLWDLEFPTEPVCRVWFTSRGDYSTMSLEDIARVDNRDFEAIKRFITPEQHKTAYAHRRRVLSREYAAKSRARFLREESELEQEIARLSKENAEIREKIGELRQGIERNGGRVKAAAASSKRKATKAPKKQKGVKVARGVSARRETRKRLQAAIQQSKDDRYALLAEKSKMEREFDKMTKEEQRKWGAAELERLWAESVAEVEADRAQARARAEAMRAEVEADEARDLEPSSPLTHILSKVGTTYDPLEDLILVDVDRPLDPLEETCWDGDAEEFSYDPTRWSEGLVDPSQPTPMDIPEHLVGPVA